MVDVDRSGAGPSSGASSSAPPLGGAAPAGERPVVRTRRGAVRGVVEGGAAVFRSIPYAAPPFGDLRFAAPAPPAPWTGERDAAVFGATAPKPPYLGASARLLAEPVVPGEDCLTLSVWTPSAALGAAAGGPGLPVLVWIHGGAFQNGSGAVPSYDGGAFARDGVVAVTINYRLGVDGFAPLPGAVANRGLLDQVAALEWVRDEVAAFGGDPARVTVAGESAGAMSAATLASLPAARGLFARVIAQSGAGHHVLSPATAALVTAAVADHLGVAPTAAGLAAVPVADLLAAQAAVSARIATAPDPSVWGEIAGNGMPFEPVVDGDVLAARPIDALDAGAGAGVDVLVGSNDDEMDYFLGPTGALDATTEERARGALAALGAAPQAYDAYRELVGEHRARPARPGDALSAGMTDWVFRLPAQRLAAAQVGAGASAWVYEFAWPSPVLDGVVGAGHGVEVAFAFDTLDADGAASLVGDAPPQQLADAVHAAWVAFVRDGDPGWAPWTASSPARPTRRFGAPGEAPDAVVDDPAAARRALWPHR